MEIEEWLLGIGFLAIISYMTAEVGVVIFQEIVDWIFKSQDLKIKIFSICMLLAVFFIFRKRAKEAMPPEAMKVERKVKSALKKLLRKGAEKGKNKL